MSFSLWWLARHDAVVIATNAAIEHERERRRILAMQATTDVRWSDDFEGCVE